MYKTPKSVKIKKTSTPQTSSEFNITDISTISTASNSRDKIIASNKRKVKCRLNSVDTQAVAHTSGSENTQDDSDQLHNIYLLALATTKLQEKKLAELTAKNEDRRLALLSELEKQREYVSSLKECKAEVKFLLEQTRHLKLKETMDPVMDEVSDKLKNLESLKDSLQMGLPVKGFIPEKNPDELYRSLSLISSTLKVVDSPECKISTKTADALEKTQESLSNIMELQSRCKAAASELNSRTLEENVLKVVKAMELLY